MGYERASGTGLGHRLPEMGSRGFGSEAGRKRDSFAFLVVSKSKLTSSLPSLLLPPLLFLLLQYEPEDSDSSDSDSDDDLPRPESSDEDSSNDDNELVDEEDGGSPRPRRRRRLDADGQVRPPLFFRFLLLFLS